MLKIQAEIILKGSSEQVFGNLRTNLLKIKKTEKELLQIIFEVGLIHFAGQLEEKIRQGEGKNEK